MKHKPSLETSPLLRQISEAIERLHPTKGKLLVSIASEPKWETSPSNADEVLVRWLCWSIEDGDEEILPPAFAVVASDVTEEHLRAELPNFFPMIQVCVDGNIDA